MVWVARVIAISSMAAVRERGGQPSSEGGELARRRGADRLLVALACCDNM